MIVLTATPLPTSPTRGEVPASALGTTEPHAQLFTSPLMGEAGRGWGSARQNSPRASNA